MCIQVCVQGYFLQIKQTGIEKFLNYVLNSISLEDETGAATDFSVYSQSVEFFANFKVPGSLVQTKH